MILEFLLLSSCTHFVYFRTLGMTVSVKRGAVKQLTTSIIVRCIHILIILTAF